MKPFTNALKPLTLKKTIYEALIVVAVLAAIGVLAWYVADQAFWNHMTA